jgi:hypothetical protein
VYEYEYESRPKNSNALGKKGAVEINKEAKVSSKAMNKRAAPKTAMIWVGVKKGMLKKTWRQMCLQKLWIRETPKKQQRFGMG